MAADDDNHGLKRANNADDSSSSGSEEDNGAPKDRGAHSAASFSMAYALSMMRMRQTELQKSASKEEAVNENAAKADDEEEKKEKARAKRQRRRKNQKLARAKARVNAEVPSDNPASKSISTGEDPPCPDQSDPTKQVPSSPPPVRSLKRAQEESESSKRLPMKKRFKIQAQVASDEGQIPVNQANDDHNQPAALPQQSSDLQQAVVSTTKISTLIPRALMVKRKATK